MHYIPAAPGFTVVQTEEALYVTREGAQVIETFAVRTDPLTAYAYEDTEDRPISVHPVLGAAHWEAHLLEAMEGEYRWYALPDDLVIGEINRLLEAHRKEVCDVEERCPYGKVGGNDRRGYGVIRHSDDCIKRQEVRRFSGHEVTDTEERIREAIA